VTASLPNPIAQAIAASGGSTVQEVLNEAGENHPAAPVQVDAVDMEPPPVGFRDLFARLAQDEETQRVAVDGQKAKAVSAWPGAAAISALSRS
jgi:hypothetical protein